MAFIETRFPENISYGASGGPGFATDVIVVNSGYEQRNSNWQDSRCAYDVSHGVKTQTQLDELIAFFRVMQGRANGFRLKDWGDYQVTSQTAGITTSLTASTFQLYKRYTTAGYNHDRKISKPVSTPLIYNNGVLATAGASFGNYSIDLTTGIVTFVNLVSSTITAITKASSAVVTVNNTFSNGDVVWFSGVGGMTEINGLSGTVSAASGTGFTVNINSTSFSTFTNVGVATKYGVTSGNPVTWTGEFDVPCRFDTDQMKPRIDAYNVYSWGGIPVVEIRT